MPEGALADRLGRHMTLTDGERATLSDLSGPARDHPRGAVLRRERDSTGTMFVLVAGWAASALNLPDGSRQITKIHLPGDILGSPGMAVEAAAENILAITDVTVRPMSKAAFGALFQTHPRLAALMFQLVQVERMVLGDRLAAIGRTSARARVAGLLIDLRERLHANDAAQGDMIPLPMTQEEIGDATGLTAVHVNRMMRMLGEEGLIARTSGHVRFLDVERLQRASGYISRWAKVDTSWFPAPRD